jgi:hypothetical protein
MARINPLPISECMWGKIRDENYESQLKQLAKEFTIKIKWLDALLKQTETFYKHEIPRKSQIFWLVFSVFYKSQIF